MPETQKLSFDVHPGLFAVSDTADGLELAHRTAEELGGRIVAAVSPEEALERLPDQLSARLIILNITADAGELLDQLMAAVTEASRSLGCRCVVICPFHLLDRLASGLWEAEADFLFDPSTTEVLASARRALLSEEPCLSDSREVTRLLELSHEFGRIVHTIAQEAGEQATGEGDDDPCDATLIRAIIRARQLRGQYFDARLFADPAFDILLDLLAARLEGREVPVSSLCIASGVPATTGLRWISKLSDAGLLVRKPDKLDGRRHWIALSDQAATTFQAYIKAARETYGHLL